MPDSPTTSLSAAFQSWTTTIGIIVAAAWGAYTFIYKEIIVPKASPINISVNLGLKPAGNTHNTPGRALSAVEVSAVATNPSNRTVYIISSAFAVFGQKIRSEDTKNFAEVVDSNINQNSWAYTDKFVNVSQELIAGGRPFPDTLLRPSEATKHNVITHFPQQAYDQLQVDVYVATIGDEKAQRKVTVKWRLSDDGVDLIASYRDITGNEHQVKEDWDEDVFLKSIGFQAFATTAELSLWQ